MTRMEQMLRQYADGTPEHFKFVAFWSPPITVEHYGYVKQCGYTHLLIDQKYDALFGTEKMGQAVALAGKQGLKAILSGENFVAYPHPYAQEPAFDGVYVDEPLSIGDLEKLTTELEQFQEQYPGKCFYVNLVGMNGESWNVYSRYFSENYLKIAQRKTVSGDIYPLREPNESGVTMTSFLDYVSRVSRLGVQTDSERLFFVQTIAMHGAGWAHPARRPSYEDIRFLHYVLLSCGITGFQHFCYMSPGLPPYEKGEFREQDWACIHPDGHRTEIWYHAQKVMAELKRFENIAMKFRWKGIMPVTGTEQTEMCENFRDLEEYVQSHSYIRELSASKDLLIGCFEDDQGNVAFSLVNFADPYRHEKNNVCICLDTDETIGVIRNGEVETRSLADGVFRTVLEPGEGQLLLIPRGRKPQLTVWKKPTETPAYLKLPGKCVWRDDFTVGNQLDTYNPFGSGLSHFEFMQQGYPAGGSGRVARLYSTTVKEKDWSTYKIYLPDIAYDMNKALVLKLWFTQSAFSVSVGCDHMIKENPCVSVNTLERYGRWTYLTVPLKDIWVKGMEKLSCVSMCIGDGTPYGTTAYLDQIMLCDMKYKEETL